MDKLLRDTFIQLGLSQKEIALLLASYKLGPSPINQLAKTARLERSTAYLITQQLLEKGYLKEDFRAYRKNLIAVSPKTLLRMLSAKQRTMRRQEMELEERVGELESYYETSALLPKVTVFQGKTALNAVWKDVLSTKGEILLWTNQNTESQFFSRELHEKFISERIRKRIPIRVLAVNNEPGKVLLTRDESSLRHSRLLPINTSFSAETYLYDQKIALLDYQTDTLGIIIESEAMASTQRAMFEMTWGEIED